MAGFIGFENSWVVKIEDWRILKMESWLKNNKIRYEISDNDYHIILFSLEDVLAFKIRWS